MIHALNNTINYIRATTNAPHSQARRHPGFRCGEFGEGDGCSNSIRWRRYCRATESRTQARSTSSTRTKRRGEITHTTGLMTASRGGWLTKPLHLHDDNTDCMWTQSAAEGHDWGMMITSRRLARQMGRREHLAGQPPITHGCGVGRGSTVGLRYGMHHHRRERQLDSYRFQFHKAEVERRHATWVSNHINNLEHTMARNTDEQNTTTRIAVANNAFNHMTEFLAPTQAPAWIMFHTTDWADAYFGSNEAGSQSQDCHQTTTMIASGGRPHLADPPPAHRNMRSFLAMTRPTSASLHRVGAPPRHRSLNFANYIGHTSRHENTWTEHMMHHWKPD